MRHNFMSRSAADLVDGGPIVVQNAMMRIVDDRQDARDFGERSGR